jgi:hypothetical protein
VPNTRAFGGFGNHHRGRCRHGHGHGYAELSAQRTSANRATSARLSRRAVRRARTPRVARVAAGYRTYGP